MKLNKMTGLLVLCACGFCCTRLLAATGYSVVVNPTNTVADGISGEEVRVSWSVPEESFSFLDTINYYRLTNGVARQIWFQQVSLRGGDTQYVFKKPGEYQVSYRNYTIFGYETMASAFVTVSSTVSRVAESTNYPPQGETIVVFGDSLTQGVGATTTNMVHWLSSITGYPMVNAGVSGNTTQNALARMASDVLVHDPDLVVVLLSGNDYLQGVPVAVTATNLDTIVSSITASGSRVLVVGVYAGLLADQYRDMFHSLYTRHEVTFVPDILQDIAGNPFLVESPLHPNDEGYRRMAIRIGWVVSAIMNGYRPAFAVGSSYDGTAFRLVWPTVPGATYDVLYSPLVTAPLAQWGVVAHVTSVVQQVSFSITNEVDSGFFIIRRTD